MIIFQVIVLLTAESLFNGTLALRHTNIAPRVSVVSVVKKRVVLSELKVTIGAVVGFSPWEGRYRESGKEN